ncbi:MAG: hypoxanthine phosphoribosyltransferase [Anaerolineae bacterium]|nr:hypoxanthine phosphoribosyltransferase [Anaerolineae bacterium]
MDERTGAPIAAARATLLTDDIAEVLIGEAQIQERIAALGAQISADYAGKDPLLVGVLRGVFIFMADLVRAITIPIDVDFIGITRYGPSAQTQGVVRLTKDLDIFIQDRHVLFVEDIIDTGLSLRYILRTLRTRQPASLKVCALFSKPRKRLFELEVDYVGFMLPDRFVVGYGLDYDERYRNLPFVGVLKEEAITQRRLPATG